MALDGNWIGNGTGRDQRRWLEALYIIALYIDG